MVNKKPISSIIITEEVEVVNRIKETNKVQHHNELIKSFARIDKAPLKILEVAISCIDVDNPPKDNTIYINKQDLFKTLNINNTAMYTDFKKYMITLQKQIFNITTEKKEKLINLTSMSEWSVEINDNYIKIKFNDEIMPYLLETKGHFTNYQLKETLELNSKHSIVLYKWLIMNFNKWKKYGNKKCKKPSIEVKELRNLTNTLDVYNDRFSVFELRILKEPIEEINLKTSLNVSYEKIKKGRPVVSIQFFIEEKKKDYLKLDDVVDEESMIEYEKQQEEYEEKRRLETLNSEDNNKIYIEAMQNIFIQKMINSQLLNMGSIEGVCLAYKRIVPIYEEIEKKYKGKAKNKDWFMYHSAHVKETFNNQKSEKEKNSYLIDAARSYLEVVEKGNAY